MRRVACLSCFNKLLNERSPTILTRRLSVGIRFAVTACLSPVVGEMECLLGEGAPQVPQSLADESWVMVERSTRRAFWSPSRAYRF